MAARQSDSVGSTPCSSRHSDAQAGWDCASGPIDPSLSEGPAPSRMSWFNPRMWWLSRNDVLAKHVADPVARERGRWVGGRSDAELTVDLTDRLDEFSFLLMGDTGEGDNSQKAVVRPLLAHAPGTAFLFICSDVLYPIGDVNDYGPKFYKPYTGYPGPTSQETRHPRRHSGARPAHTRNSPGRRSPRQLEDRLTAYSRIRV